MVWTVLISSKEPNAQDLVARLVEAGISANTHDLAVCDIVFELDRKTYVQAEIKTQRDLLASITVDCRYHEQTASMSVSGVPYTFYLLRGYRAGPGILNAEQIKIEHAMTRAQLSGSLNATQQSTRTHIGMIPLTSEDGVFSWIQYVHKNLVEDPVLTDGVLAPLTDNVKHAFGSKPANRDQSRVYAEMLSRITGIAIEKARALSRVYPTMSILIEFLHQCETPAEIVKSFSALKIGLGKKAAEHVYVQLLRNDERKFTF